jgi:predicted MPP superfamily phosphohydrolase
LRPLLLTEPYLHCDPSHPDYAGVVFWYWFHATLNVLTLSMDAVWWIVAMRLTKRRLWRVLVSIFLAGQMAALLSLLCDFDWRPHAPQAVLVAVVTWHYLALGLALTVLLPVGIVRTGAWMVRAVRARNRPSEAPQRLSMTAAAAENSSTRRQFLGACAALVPPVFSVGLTGLAVAQLQQLRVRRFTLSLPALPRALDGITIAHLSDIHLGGLTSARVLREMVNTTNALRADLVLMTGDLINYELADLSEGIALLKSMEGRYGLWLVEGNHDLFDNGGEFERRVKAAGLPLLLDESAVAHVRGYPVQLFGLKWMGVDVADEEPHNHVADFQLRDMLKQRQPDAFPILLAHHPHTFDAAVKAGLPLTLAGHTHGGFWMLDSRHGIGPALFRYWSGLYTRGRSQMIVSNGIGNWSQLPPLRINAPAEIIHLTLRCAETRDWRFAGARGY